MKRHGKKKVWLVVLVGLVLGGLLVSCGVPTDGEPTSVAIEAAPASEPKPAQAAAGSVPPVGSVADGPELQPIAGTKLAVPVPPPEIGTQVEDLTIPLPDGRSVARGVAFYRPGPMTGSIVGGVAVVFDDSAAVRAADGGVADVDAIAALVNPELDPQVTTVGTHTVLGWPDSEVVPSEGIPQGDRPVSRYVILLDDGIVMVTFDDVAAAQAEGYLADVAGAL